MVTRYGGEVRRVLRDDGTVWLNLGDSYSGGGRTGHEGGTMVGTKPPMSNVQFGRPE